MSILSRVYKTPNWRWTSNAFSKSLLGVCQSIRWINIGIMVDRFYVSLRNRHPINCSLRREEKLTLHIIMDRDVLSSYWIFITHTHIWIVILHFPIVAIAATMAFMVLHLLKFSTQLNWWNCCDIFPLLKSFRLLVLSSLSKAFPLLSRTLWLQTISILPHLMSLSLPSVMMMTITTTTTTTTMIL